MHIIWFMLSSFKNRRKIKKLFFYLIKIKIN